MKGPLNGWSATLHLSDRLRIARRSLNGPTDIFRVPRWRWHFTLVLAGSQEASYMWGVIAKLTLLPGKRDEMVGILKDSAADMPGCLSYVVAKDAADENTIWVTEVWKSMTSHDASLSLPVVKNAIPRGERSF